MGPSTDPIAFPVPDWLAPHSEAMIEAMLADGGVDLRSGRPRMLIHTTTMEETVLHVRRARRATTALITDLAFTGVAVGASFAQACVWIRTSCIRLNAARRFKLVFNGGAGAIGGSYAFRAVAPTTRLFGTRISPIRRTVAR